MSCALVLTALAAAARAHAHGGDLDPTFGSNGIAYYGLSVDGSCASGANAVAVHPDGSLWVAGWSTQDADNESESAAYLKLDPRGAIVADDYGYEPGGELRSVAIDPATGVVYVAGTIGNRVSVRALNPDGSFATTFGTGGEAFVAVGGDLSHQTTVNDLRLDPGGTLYLTGGYNGSGIEEVMLADIGSDGTVRSAEAEAEGGTDFVSTAIALPSSGRVLTAGYQDGICVTYAFDVTFSGGGFHFTPETGFGPRYGFAGSSGCFVDAAAVAADGGLIEVGRFIAEDGSWQPMLQEISPTGTVTAVTNSDFMTSWGDNSPRSVLVQPDGEWVIVGFTGMDLQASPGAWAGRFFSDGTADTRFGTDGATLIDFDRQDIAYGKAFGAALDRYGRVLITGTYWNGNSAANGSDCSTPFVARLQSDDLIYTDAFDDIGYSP